MNAGKCCGSSENKNLQFLTKYYLTSVANFKIIKKYSGGGGASRIIKRRRNMNMKTLPRIDYETRQRSDKNGLRPNWSVDFFADERPLSSIPMTVAVDANELEDIMDSVYTYNILRTKNPCIAYLYYEYFKNIADSKAFVEQEYVKESYMGKVGKHSVETVLMTAISENAMKIEWLETKPCNNKNCYLYKGSYYVTRNMIKTLITNMVSKMYEWQLNNYMKQFKTDLSKKKSVKMLADYIFDTFIVSDKDINCNELQFITDCLKAYKHETVF